MSNTERPLPRTAERYQMLTAAQAAQLCSMSVSSWRRYAPPACRFGAMSRWRVADVITWQEEALECSEYVPQHTSSASFEPCGLGWTFGYGLKTIPDWQRDWI